MFNFYYYVILRYVTDVILCFIYKLLRTRISFKISTKKAKIKTIAKHETSKHESMGNIFSCKGRLSNVIEPYCSEKHNVTILIVGLDGAGKTTIFDKLTGKTGKNRKTKPTLGFSNSYYKCGRYKINLFDVGGSSTIRANWKYYYNDSHGIIFVVDASDKNKLEESRLVFKNLISDERIRGKPILILANKQDLTETLDELEIIEALDVEKLVNCYKCFTTIKSCSTLCSTSNMRQTCSWLVEQITQDFKQIDERVKSNIEMQSEQRLKEYKNWKINKKDGNDYFDKRSASSLKRPNTAPARFVKSAGSAWGLEEPLDVVTDGETFQEEDVPF